MTLMLMPQVNKQTNKQTDNTALITLFIDLMLCKTTNFLLPAFYIHMAW